MAARKQIVRDIRERIETADRTFLLPRTSYRDLERKWDGRDRVGTGGNAQRSGAGWVSARDKLHGRVVGRQPVVEMAPPVIMIRWLTDECGTLPRVASKRVR